MKATLITGASGGIGEAFARKLAAKGHNLVLVARTENKLAAICDELKSEFEIEAHYIAVDLTEFQSDTQLFAETEKHGLEIDCLINNAGYGTIGDFSDLDLENELRMITLNIMALVALTHRYLAPMRERREGVIINVSSTASFQPIPYFATYAATKAFVTSFSEAIAEENRKFGIRILNLCPGPTETGFFEAAKMDSKAKKAFASKGIQTPEDVVDTALEAIDRGKTTVISGWVNYVISIFGYAAPDWLVSRFMARQLRSRFTPTNK
ncbi:MAG: SDR family oxidoreductase [Pyrinomonadaceae bacterium]|nr:SDR family oxidoreductase [Pyrinomonadaceae bacterium]